MCQSLFFLSSSFLGFSKFTIISIFLTVHYNCEGTRDQAQGVEGSGWWFGASSWEYQHQQPCRRSNWNSRRCYIYLSHTLATSLIVTGVGVGVGSLGGITSRVSNITNIVTQSTDCKATHSIIKEFEQKINAAVLWLQEISYSLQTISRQFQNTCDSDDNLPGENMGFRAGKGLTGIT